MTQRQAVASASAAPFLAAVAGATAGVAGAIVASQWMPIGAAAIMEPHPGLDADWLVLGAGWVIAPLLVLAGSAVAAAAALTAGRAAPPAPVRRRGGRAGARLPGAGGDRHPFRPGTRTRPVRRTGPARSVGAVAGVLGVLAAFTFSAGVSDAAANPARFGQTWQLSSFFAYNGQDFGPASQVLHAVAADRDVIGVDDARIGGAQSGQVSIESSATPRWPANAARRPDRWAHARGPDDIALAPITARELHAVTGSTIRLTGGAATRLVRVTGIAFVPAGPHNGYADGAWLTPAGYDRIFAGAHYSFKFHAAAVTLRPGANVPAVSPG